MRETECTIILLSLMSCYLISISFFFCKPIPTSAEVKIHNKKMILSSSHIPHYPRSSYNITLSLLQIPYLIFLQQDTPYKRTPPPSPSPFTSGVRTYYSFTNSFASPGDKPYVPTTRNDYSSATEYPSLALFD